MSGHATLGQENTHELVFMILESNLAIQTSYIMQVKFLLSISFEQLSPKLIELLFNRERWE